VTLILPKNLHRSFSCSLRPYVIILSYLKVPDRHIVKILWTVQVCILYKENVLIKSSVYIYKDNKHKRTSGHRSIAKGKKTQTHSVLWFRRYQSNNAQNEIWINSFIRIHNVDQYKSSKRKFQWTIFISVLIIFFFLLILLFFRFFRLNDLINQLFNNKNPFR
jgi:hypothetical protein